MKKSLLICIITLCSFVTFAQSDLLVHSSTNGLHLNHTVSAKENFYSIGRLYNISPKEIAAFNNLDMNNGLNIGQSIMIPLTKANFSQASDKGTPVFYVVGDREGLYRVSLKNNNVLMANLRKWNSLDNDNISAGQKLIVGFVVSSELTASPIATAPKKEQPMVAEEKPKPQQAETARRADPEPVKQETASTTPRPQFTGNDANGGYFKSQYDQQSRTQKEGREQTATAGIFKTASGWQDEKYYALIDGVEPGTIVRVVNPSNNKAIYAKVLGAMSGISQNKGLDVRISNAAANVLDISDTEKFVVKVAY